MSAIPREDIAYRLRFVIALPFLLLAAVSMFVGVFLARGWSEASETWRELI